MIYSLYDRAPSTLIPIRKKTRVPPGTLCLDKNLFKDSRSIYTYICHWPIDLYQVYILYHISAKLRRAGGGTLQRVPANGRNHQKERRSLLSVWKRWSGYHCNWHEHHLSILWITTTAFDLCARGQVSWSAGGVQQMCQLGYVWANDRWTDLQSHMGRKLQRPVSFVRLLLHHHSIAVLHAGWQYESASLHICRIIEMISWVLVKDE